MSRDRVERIELRWLPNKDFGPIAGSPNGLSAKQLTGLATLPPGVADGHRSLVYLPLENGPAVLVERLFDRNAVPLHGGGEELGESSRRPLVAHALVGPVHVLSTDLALACLNRGMSDGLGLQAGRLQPGSELEPVHPSRFEEFFQRVMPEVDGTDRQVHGLAAVIDAVLRDPLRRIAVVLPPDQIRSGELQQRFLLGLFSTVEPLLNETDGWSPSFSTHEPPSGTHGTSQPRLTFREPHSGAASAYYSGGNETVIKPYDQELQPHDEIARTALLLAAFYLDHGREAGRRLLRPIGEQTGTPLEERIRMAADAAAGGGGDYSEPATGGPADSGPTDPEVSDVPYEGRHEAPAAQDPQQVPPPQAQPSHTDVPQPRPSQTQAPQQVPPQVPSPQPQPWQYQPPPAQQRPARQRPGRRHRRRRWTRGRAPSRRD